VNVPLEASRHVLPFVEVSKEYGPVEALPPSPQVLDGSIAISKTSTFTGSLTTTTLGVTRRPLTLRKVLQPLYCDRSNIDAAPQPTEAPSSPFVWATAAPPESAAQSRRSCQFAMSVEDRTETVRTCR